MPTRSSVGAGRTSGVAVGAGTTVTVSGSGVWMSRIVSKSPQGSRLFGSATKASVSSGVTVAAVEVATSVAGSGVAADPHAEMIMTLNKTTLTTDHTLTLLYILSP